MNTKEASIMDAYQQGRRQAEQHTANGVAALRHNMESGFKWARSQYLGVQDLDLADALLTFSRERMESDLDVSRYPECRGLREKVTAVRQGVADVIGDPLLTASVLDWNWFTSRRLNTRYVGRTPPPAQCTDVWFSETGEGGPIHGTNRDDVLYRYIGQDYRARNSPKGHMRPCEFKGIMPMGGVSSSVLCDEEPECLFPVDLKLVIPEGVTDLKEYVGYMDRYRDFWGPANQLWADADLQNFAALEKANVRMGVRYSTGWAAITACAYLTPEMNAFKKSRDLISFEVRGWPADDNTDQAYWAGAEARHHRLMKLCEREHAAGATAAGVASIVLDHDVPFPERICLAGERGHADEPQDMQNWTLLTVVRVANGPNARSYHWVIDADNPRPIYETDCMLATAETNADRRAEWEATAPFVQ